MSFPRFRLSAALLFVAGVAVAADPAPRLPSLERAVYDAVPDVLAHLNARREAIRPDGVLHYGVLKFAVAVDGKNPSDNAGPLNLRVTRALEMALALRMTADDAGRLRGLRDASAVAARLKGRPGHLTADGRKALLEAEYPSAWGADDKARPDVLLTGVLLFEPDGRSARLCVLAFDREERELKRVGKVFTAGLDLDALAESGSSFTFRKPGDFADFDNPVSPSGKADAPALANLPRPTPTTPDARPRPHPLEVGLPVDLEVRYDGKPVRFEFRPSAGENRAFLPEPEEGQKVAFVLRRRDKATRDVYGVVLKVNGMNTIEKQRLPVSACRRWVIGPGEPDVVVEGFYFPKEKDGVVEAAVEAFRVASVAESADNEVNYGEDSGTLTLAVFKSVPKPPVVDETAVATNGKPASIKEAAVRADLLAMTRAADLLGTRAAGLQDLKADVTTRGLIEPGPVFAARARIVPFENPQLIDAVTITYRPRGK